MCKAYDSYLSRLTIPFLASLLLIIPGLSIAATKHEVYFPNTQYELNVYKIYGHKPGKTLLIIGGIQGNEPGGYLAADLYADMSLEKGNLIVVPRANFYSILLDQRGPNGDMNRKFIASAARDYDGKIVSVLKRLIAESDYLLNLHDGSGFYSSNWESKIRNPLLYGQSIIADTDFYYSKNKSLHLGDIARKVASAVNEYIDNPDFHFHFNNHRTSSPDSSHAEQRKSATYYALTHHEIPAFGIETSKNIESVKLRIKFQTIVINAFMKEFGIIPENPRIYLDPPLLKYLVISINDSLPSVVFNQRSLILQKGDSIEISHIEANYERGLSVDILTLGTKNDYRKKFVIDKPTTIIVKKDKYKCGEIPVSLASQDKGLPSLKRADVAPEVAPEVLYFILEINGTKRVFSNNERLKIVKGDKIKIVDLVTRPSEFEDVTVNFLGFVGDKSNNTGEDRGYTINTAKDLWQKYSVRGEGMEYRISVKDKNSEIARMHIELMEPEFNYLVVKHNGKERVCYNNGEVIRASYGDCIEIVDLRTNITDNSGVKVNFRGYIGGDDGEDRNYPIRLDGSLRTEYSIEGKGRQYEILVSREGLQIGRVIVKIDETPAQ
ncbi:MAG: M14/M99 family metallopeptidase [Pseudomonadota bacterium]